MIIGKVGGTTVSGGIGPRTYTANGNTVTLNGARINFNSKSASASVPFYDLVYYGIPVYAWLIIAALVIIGVAMFL